MYYVIYNIHRGKQGSDSNWVPTVKSLAGAMIPVISMISLSAPIAPGRDITALGN